MQTYTTTAKHHQPKAFINPDLAELYKAQVNGAVEVSEIDENDTDWTERLGEEISINDNHGEPIHILTINTYIDRKGNDPEDTENAYYLESVTVHGVDIDTLNLTPEFADDIAREVDKYLNELNEN